MRELTDRRGFTKGLAAILAAGAAPNILISEPLQRGYRGIGARLGVMGGEGLPYDEELECITSNGSAYILFPSLFSVGEPSVLYIDADAHGLPVSMKGLLTFGENISGSRINIVTNDRGGLSVFVYGYIEKKFNNKARVEFGFNNSKGVKITVDGEISPSYNSENVPILFKQSSALFAFTNGSGICVSGVEVGCFRCIRNGNISFCGVPVLKNGEAMIFDSVSKTLFSKQGTGTFGYKKKDGTIVSPR